MHDGPTSISPPTSFWEDLVSVSVVDSDSVRELDVVLSVPCMMLLLTELELVVPVVSEPPDCRMQQAQKHGAATEVPVGMCETKSVEA